MGYGENSTLVKSEALPDLPQDPIPKPTLSDTLANLWMPLAALIPAEIFDNPKPGLLDVTLSVIGTLASVGIGWWVGRRYCDEPGRADWVGNFHPAAECIWFGGVFMRAGMAGAGVMPELQEVAGGGPRAMRALRGGVRRGGAQRHRDF